VAVTEPPVDVLVTRHAAMGVVIDLMVLLDPPEMPPTFTSLATGSGAYGRSPPIEPTAVEEWGPAPPVACFNCSK